MSEDATINVAPECRTSPVGTTCAAGGRTSVVSTTTPIDATTPEGRTSPATVAGPAGEAGAPEPVTLLFDVRSPWCYQTSRWLRRLAELGEVTLSFGVFSLEVVNLHTDEDPAAYDAEFGPALRVALALRADHGQRAIGDFYAAFGTRMWETPAPEGEPLPDVPELTRLALADIGIAPGYADQVLAEPASWAAVLTEHQHWARTLRVFGVPTLIVGHAGGADEGDAASDRAVNGRAANDDTANGHVADDRAANDRAASRDVVSGRAAAASGRAVNGDAADDRAVNGRAVGHGAAGNRGADDRAVDDGAANDGAVDRAVNGDAANDRAVNDGAAVDRAVNGDAAKDRAVNDGVVNDGADDRAVNGGAADDRAANDGAADDRAADRDAASDRAASGRDGTVAREAGTDSGLDAIFGPVLQYLPSDDDGLALWRHMRGLARLGTLYELKRYKSLHSRAGLPNAVPRADLRVADMRAARALMRDGGPYAGASLEWVMSQVRSERAGTGEARPATAAEAGHACAVEAQRPGADEAQRAAVREA